MELKLFHRSRILSERNCNLRIVSISGRQTSLTTDRIIASSSSFTWNVRERATSILGILSLRIKREIEIRMRYTINYPCIIAESRKTVRKKISSEYIYNANFNSSEICVSTFQHLSANENPKFTGNAVNVLSLRVVVMKSQRPRLTR